MKNKFKNQSVLIVATVMVLIVACIVLFFIKPMISKVYKDKNKLEETKLYFENLKNEGSKTKEYKDKINNFSENKALIENAIVKDDSQVSLIEELESVGAEVGCKAEIKYYTPPKKRNVIAPAQPVATNQNQADSQEGVAENQSSAPAQALPAAQPTGTFFMISLESTYSQFLSYLYHLENLHYITSVNSISVRAYNELELQKLLDRGESIENKDIQADILISFIPEK